MIWDAGGPWPCIGSYQLIRTPDINGDGYPDRVEKFNYESGYCGDHPSNKIEVSTKRGDRESLKKAGEIQTARGYYTYKTKNPLDWNGGWSHIQVRNPLPPQIFGPLQLFSQGDLVEISSGARPFRARILAFYFGFNKDYRQVRRGARLGLGGERVVDLNDLKLIQPVADLEKQVDLLKNQAEQIFKKKIDRKRKIKKITHLLARKISALRLDEDGKLLLREKLQQQLNLHIPVDQLALR